MKIKQSSLELINIVLINFDCKFTAPVDGTNIRELFSSYEIDVDFVFREINNQYNIFFKASINNDVSVRLKGYSVFIECVGVYRFTDDTLDNSTKDVLLTNSALVMTLNFLRTKLADITSQFPLGKYLLPSIDMKHLFEQKKLSKIKSKKK